MQTTNSVYPLNVLVVRPTKKAQALTLLLNKQGIACVSQPLFDYLPLADHIQSERLLTTADILIFVSAAAVEFAHANVATTHWKYQHIIAVGKATKAALQALALKNIQCPSQENSEGVLALSTLNENLSNKTITIVRGNGGREHLAIELVKRGAMIHYLESYQRVWRTFPKDINKQWYQQQINCIVVTSNALLDKLVQLTQATNVAVENDTTKYWRNQCIWLVASKRIANQAQQLGLVNVIQSDGANEQAISTTLQAIIENKC
ncbi:uroporphyrinogen-III synthase [Candidatus Colwellia aromaticivorans]|uniref:uroporphyrinogen-III synthase n=1 Tax=Candidatus Colwellia aromaticivorans TaxID=2267621 RepID=UPI000DF27BDF|nr:uroporphyrinogen-III synthase [Candidatus Colwellia aromaticivorans]